MGPFFEKLNWCVRGVHLMGPDGFLEMLPPLAAPDDDGLLAHAAAEARWVLNPKVLHGGSKAKKLRTSVVRVWKAGAMCVYPINVPDQVRRLPAASFRQVQEQGKNRQRKGS